MLTVIAMAGALHRRSILRSLLTAQGEMQFGQECGDRMPYQQAVAGGDEVNGGAIGYFDKPLLINRQNSRWAGFDQDAQPFVCLRGQATVSNQLADEHTAACDRQSLENQADRLTGGV